MILRRDLIRAGLALPFSTLLPRPGFSQDGFAPLPGSWRRFEILTKLELAAAEGGAQAWIPLPGFVAEDWFRPGKSRGRPTPGQRRSNAT